MTTEPTIVALPVNVTAEMLQLEDGSAVAIELAQPRRRWAVFRHAADGNVDVVAVLDDESQAERLAAEMSEARAKGLQ